MREREKMKKPKHVFEGLEKGGKAVFHGFKEGITGLFMKPIENTKKEGAIGFFKGTAQGLAGLVFKPVSGVIGFAENTVEGVKNTVMYSQDRPNDARIRFPRVLYTETGMVKEYDPIDSKLQAIMNKENEYFSKSGFYFMESYKIGERSFLVVTSGGIVAVDIQDDKTLWNLKLTELRCKRVQDSLIEIRGTPKDKGFFDKDVKQNVMFEDKEQADRFERLVENMKLNAGVF